MENIQLTEHFSLAEFERSTTASALCIDNTIPERYIPSIRNLCEQVLEPLRRDAGQPVIISSGYRCQALNRAVGGVRNSQHLSGEAADLVVGGPGHCFKWSDKYKKLLQWRLYLVQNTNFDQCILEHNQYGNYWLHVSCKPESDQNRQEVVYC